MNRISLTRTVVALAGAMTGVLLAAAPASAQQESGAALRLTLAEAVERAIEHNPDLAIVRLDTEVEAARVGERRGVYAPIISTMLGRSRNVTPPTNYLL